MLIDFAVTNFRSINERQVFSMKTVSRIKDSLDNVMVVPGSGENVLRTTAIFGRNASGKSNLLRALEELSAIVSNRGYNVSENYQPFKLSPSQAIKPTVFEITFIADNGEKYAYSIAYNNERVVSERLDSFSKGKRHLIFQRSENKIKTGKDLVLGDHIVEELYPYHSLLSRINFHKVEKLQPAFQFFSRHFITAGIIGSLQDYHLKKNLIQCNLPNYLENIAKLLKIADTGIEGLEVERKEMSDFNFPEHYSEGLKKAIFKRASVTLQTVHNVYDGEKIVGNKIFDFEEEESGGTQKLAQLGSIILDCLFDGDVLVVDELDAKLHPLLIHAIVEIFNDPKTNPNNAQLIFTTHDLTLWDTKGLLRRDQIWLAEKDYDGRSSYYSVADFTGVRKGADLLKQYLSGLYGGLPLIDKDMIRFNFSSDEQEPTESK